MLTEALNIFCSRIRRNLFCIFILAFNYLTLVILSGMAIEEYDKFAPFYAIKGKTGVFIQTVENDWFGDDFIEKLLSDDVELFSIHNTECYCDDFFGKSYSLEIAANDKLEYYPFIHTGVLYKNADVPDNYIGVICSDNVNGIKPGMVITCDDGIKLYVTGLFAWNESLLGCGKEKCYGINLYDILYSDYSKSNEEYLDYIYNNTLFIVGDYETLKNSGILFNFQSYNFLVYPKNTDYKRISNDIDRINNYLISNSSNMMNPSFILDSVTIKQFEKESREHIFDVIGKLFPLGIATMMILVISFINICFANMQESERENNIRRMLGYKIKDIVELETLNTLYLLFCSFIVFNFGRVILHRFDILEKYLALKYFNILLLMILSSVVLLLNTYVPYLHIRNQKISDGLKMKEWS